MKDVVSFSQVEDSVISIRNQNVILDSKVQNFMESRLEK